MKYLILLALILIFNSTQATEVSLMRCKKGVVTLGMDKYKVMNLCGTPLEKEVLSGSNQNKIEKLVYKFKRSKSSPMTFFTFSSGKLIVIEFSK